MACRRAGAAEHPFPAQVGAPAWGFSQGPSEPPGGRAPAGRPRKVPPRAASRPPAPGALRYVKSRSFAVRDAAQKALAVHVAAGRRRRRLVALHLRGTDREATLRLDFYKPLAAGPGVPVALRVDGCGLLLSCEEAAVPALRLEEADGPVPEIGAEQRRFLFFRHCSGTTCRFESALSPGWFLATAARDRAPLVLAPAAAPGAILDFHLYPSAAMPPPRPGTEPATVRWHGHTQTV